MATSTPSAAFLAEFCGNELVAFASAFIVIDTFFVLLRVFSTYISKRKVGMDDWLTIPALFFNLAACSIAIAFVKHAGVGHHVEEVALETPEILPLFAKLEVTFACMYLLSVTFPKIVILCLFLRILVERWQRIACYVLIGVLIAAATGTILANVLQCIPLHYMWDTADDGRHCFDQNKYWQWGSFPNILTDVAMLLLPIPALMTLRLSFKDKLGVSITFLTGGIGLVTSILRFAIFLRVDGLGPTADGTWSAVKLVIYSIAEGGVYLIASCLPAFRSLYLVLRGPKFPTSITHGSNSFGFTKRGKSFSNSNDEIPLSGTYTKEEVTVNVVPAGGKFQRLEDDCNLTPQRNYSQSATCHAEGGAENDQQNISVQRGYVIESHLAGDDRV